MESTRSGTARKAFFNWSSGKDSALALYRLLQDGAHDVRALFSVVNDSGLVSMHEVDARLLERQAESIGIPLRLFRMHGAGGASGYKAAMGEAMEAFRHEGISTAAFGDIYLEDLRRSRERNLAESGMEAVFPLWGADPRALMREFIGLGFKSIVTCVDCSVLDAGFVGRVIDAEFVADLPPSVDVCGEMGEYHSFVFDGPLFAEPVAFSRGETTFAEFDDPEGGMPDRFCHLGLLADSK